MSLQKRFWRFQNLKSVTFWKLRRFAKRYWNVFQAFLKRSSKRSDQAKFCRGVKSVPSRSVAAVCDIYCDSTAQALMISPKWWWENGNRWILLFVIVIIQYKICHWLNMARWRYMHQWTLSSLFQSMAFCRFGTRTKVNLPSGFLATNLIEVLINPK